MTTTELGIVHTLTTATFDEAVGAADRPYIVDFWATWCGPCVPYAAVLAELADEQVAHLLVGKVDIDAEPELARRYAVMSAPTLLVFVGGQPVDRIVGARGIARLRQDLSAYL